VATRPRLGAVQVTTAVPAVRVLDAHQLEVFLPVRPLFLQRLSAEADLDPADAAVVAQPGLLHVPHVFVAGHGPLARGAVFDGQQQVGFAAGFDTRGYQIAHGLFLSFTHRSAL